MGLNRMTRIVAERTQDDTSHLRTRRSVNPESNKFNISVFTLQDSHMQLIVHWAGRSSDVLVALAKNGDQSGKQNDTVVYFSYDYGRTFMDRTKYLTIDSKTPAIINKFFNSPVYNSHYVFADVIHKYIFTTMDYGQTFSKIQLPFVPDVISLHATNDKVILAMNRNDTEKKLWLSEDFGETWTIMQSHVKSFYWGVKDIDAENVLFVERLEPSGKSSVLKYPDFSTNMQNIEVLITDVEDFQLKDKYMFGTRRVRLLGSKTAPKGLLQLWVSYNRGPFQHAIFPNQTINVDYYIPDASEDQVFVCVTHDNKMTNLYVSDIKGVEYSLSLERILYFNPKGIESDTWLSYVADESFADFHKVAGLSGIYIASQLKPNYKEDGLGPEDIITLITFDKGGAWNPIIPPVVDQRGHSIHCKMSDNCSLHLSQRLNQLFPATRSTPIRSQSSAIGLIMATGVLGTSLKGHPAIFLSVNAGSSWNKVLDGTYYYAFGDYGGLIVAVKAFLGEGATSELLYSIDEGETWQTLTFANESIRVYGLMTEPGEKTTVFTLFGSRPTKHQWLIITVDLRPAFARQCKSDDYKQWSPRDNADSQYRHCLLGQQEVYQRRISRINCYNGEDYERAVSVEKCECMLQDFECDVGYKWDSNEKFCVLYEGSGFHPATIPTTCRPGNFYNKTRGYRKIPGDVCEGGMEDQYTPKQIACPVPSVPEFILFTQRQVISRMPLSLESHIDRLPVLNLRNVIAIEYDFVNNTLYWADIDQDTISGLRLDGKSEPEILVEVGLSSIEGLALDWITNNLYFVDGERAKIEVIRTDIKHMGRLRRTILDKPTLDKPRGIALNPFKGYMFWTDWGSKPSISSCYLDGSNVKQLITQPVVVWPNGITIDYQTNRIYWVDAKLDYIASAAFDGSDMKHLIKSGSMVPHPFAIAIYKDWMYWDDWTRQAILVADKYDGSGIQVVAPALTAIMDLKIYDQGRMMMNLTNPCHPSKTNCTHLCVPQPDGVVCLCPDGFRTEKIDNNRSEKCLCDDHEEMDENGMCKEKSGSCPSESFTCRKTGLCIPLLWQCDGDHDCFDGSDEDDCQEKTCASNQFTCKNGPCIPLRWRCDQERDCLDGSDEEQCKYATCSADEFTCKNGRCIDKRWRCDIDDDCHDGSDEVNCSSVIIPSSDCEEGEFKCNSSNLCVHLAWRCDGENDCEDGSDEKNCADHKCQAWQYQCKNGHCIFSTWVCDGHDDCGDNSDESNCSHTTPAITEAPTTDVATGNCSVWRFACHSSNRCIPAWWRCDQIPDCTDGSDEFDCVYTTLPSETTTAPTTASPVDKCEANHFQCFAGNCIWESWVCDGEKDCSGGEDEFNCTIHCGPNHFRCLHSAGCIPRHAVCNGIFDCADSSDESGCSSTDLPAFNLTNNCGFGSFECAYGACIPSHKRCDEHKDCMDGSDELSCEGVDREYGLKNLWVDSKSVTDDSLSISWVPQSESLTKFEYLPALREAHGPWQNASWTQETTHTFTNLDPYTLYTITVFMRVKGKPHVSNPSIFIHQKTMQGIPKPPRNVSFTEEHTGNLVINWDLPEVSYGITGYRVYFPPDEPLYEEVESTIGRHQYHLKHYLSPGVHYKIYMTSVAGVLESNHSNELSYFTDPKSVLKAVEDLNISSVTNRTAELNWTKMESKIADDYLIIVRSPNDVYNQTKIIVKEPPYTITNLAPGTSYTIKVSPRNGTIIGPPNSKTFKTAGNPLQPPRNLRLRLLDKTTVNMAWELPNDKRNVQWEYGIYFGRSVHEMQTKGIVAKTFKLSYDVVNLHSCELYVFEVRIVGPFGVGPADGFQMTTTEYDHQSPPKRPNVFVSDSVAKIKWRSACEGHTGMSYNIRIYDTIRKQEWWFNLAKTFNITNVYHFNVKHGGIYTVQIQNSFENARLTEPVTFRGPPLPLPYQLQLHQVTKSDYELDWKLENVSNSIKKYSYIVLISQNESDFSRAETVELNEPKMSLSSLGEGHIYYLAVQLKDENGYLSERSSVVAYNKLVDDDSVIFSSSSLMVILIIVGIVFVALIAAVAALGLLYVRHKRLQRATLSFANSHYNTRSGATTFSTGDELGDFIDEEDSPMIRGFSDDEPLVIA